MKRIPAVRWIFALFVIMSNWTDAAQEKHSVVWLHPYDYAPESGMEVENGAIILPYRDDGYACLYSIGVRTDGALTTESKGIIVRTVVDVLRDSTYLHVSDSDLETSMHLAKRFDVKPLRAFGRDLVAVQNAEYNRMILRRLNSVGVTVKEIYLEFYQYHISFY